MLKKKESEYDELQPATGLAGKAHAWDVLVRKAFVGNEQASKTPMGVLLG